MIVIIIIIWVLSIIILVDAVLNAKEEATMPVTFGFAVALLEWDSVGVHETLRVKADIVGSISSN